MLSPEKSYFFQIGSTMPVSLKVFELMFVKAETAKILNTPIPVYIFKKLFHT